MREGLHPYMHYGIPAVLLLLTSLLNWRISLGLVLGYLFSQVNGKLTEMRIDALIANGASPGGAQLLSFFLKPLVIALPLLLSFLLPDIFHWAGTFLGLMIPKIILITDTILRNGSERG